MKRFALGAIVLALQLSLAFAADEETPEPGFNESTFKGLEFRSIGPAFMSGRIADIAIDPGNQSTWYVGVGSGGVWKTRNRGTTWEPIFDDEESYSIGCVTIDPNNPNTVWVGTGENVSGRHVAYGSGHLSQPRRRPELGKLRFRALRTHRHDSYRSPQLQYDLRRCAGPALVRRRRTRPVQVDRRRKNLAQGSRGRARQHGDRRPVHGRFRSPHGSPQPGCHVCRVLAANSKRRGIDGRRPRNRNPQVRGRR